MAKSILAFVSYFDLTFLKSFCTLEMFKKSIFPTIPPIFIKGYSLQIEIGDDPLP